MTPFPLIISQPEHLDVNPNGGAAATWLAGNRQVRIQAERTARPRVPSAERLAARQARARARQEALGRELGDFMSAASVVSAEDMRIHRF